MNKKKIVTVVCSAALMLSLVIGGTLAYLTDNADVTNTFTVGDIDIALEEPGWDDTTDGKDILPGDSFIKDPTVMMLDGDAYVRFKVEFIDNSAATPAAITDPARIAAILECVCYDSTFTPANTAVSPTVTAAEGTLLESGSYTTAQRAAFAGINPAFTKDAVKSSDATGTYYYNCPTIVTEGTSAPLFTHIIVPTDYDRAQLQALGAFSLKITAEAIQTEGFVDAAAAFAELG